MYRSISCILQVDLSKNLEIYPSLGPGKWWGTQLGCIIGNVSDNFSSLETIAVLGFEGKSWPPMDQVQVSVHVCSVKR